MPPDRWLELSVRCTLDPDLVSAALLGLGGTGVVESDGALVTYLPPPEELGSLLSRVRADLQAISPSTTFELQWRWQPHEDWESLWRRGLGPRRITQRLIVAPSWEEVEVEEGVIVVTVDPGMAFGTAEHATTRACLRLLDSRVRPGSRLADVGAGSGILSIAAARMGAARVMALEMDEMSCETAIENVARNGVDDRVEVVQTLVGATDPLPGGPFHGIVANLQSHLLLPLLWTFQASLASGGWLIVSGILEDQRDEVLAACLQEGFSFQEEDEEDGWWTGALDWSPTIG